MLAITWPLHVESVLGARLLPGVGGGVTAHEAACPKHPPSLIPLKVGIGSMVALPWAHPQL